MKEKLFTEEEFMDEDLQNDPDEEIDNNLLMAYDIAVFYNTYNLSALMKWWGKKLVIPDFQRAYVWNIKKASEFVDSMLRGLPVPSMFFYDDTENNRLLVIDGQQRLRSLYNFVVEQTFAGKKFKLTGNIHPRWKGRTYSELEDDDKDRLDDALMNITVMRQLAPDDGQSAMYLAFQRINTGGITLRAQEIRMAVSYGELAKRLYELSKDSRFDKWKFLRTKDQKTNENFAPIQELILKFWTYYFQYPNFTGSSTRSMLDDFFDTYRELDKPKKRKQGVKYYSWEQLKDVFDATFDIVNNLPLESISPFSKPTQTFLEAVWIGLTYRKLKLHKEINVCTLQAYISKWKEFIGEPEFSRLFQARRTSSVTSAFERIKAGIEYCAGDF